MKKMKLIEIITFIAIISLVHADSCFPMSKPFGNGPNGMTRDQWWCGTSDLHGFLGFSYPVEDDNCNDYSYNGFLGDFKRMKADYNASFVRTYLPVCTSSNFWVQMIKAARDANLGLIPMIFWDWQQNDNVMNKAEQALTTALANPEVSSIAPYIIYAVSFGDELGEQGEYWYSLMQAFKGKLATYGIKISPTDDWDRDIYRNYNQGSALTSFGAKVNALSDLTQVHVQPYYHADQAPDAYHMWPYYLNQLQLAAKQLKQPIFVTQTNWARYQGGDHNRGKDDWADTLDNFVEYWNTINNNCTTFKSLNIGWFFHSWSGEGAFDLLDDNGKPVMDFKPKFC